MQTMWKLESECSVRLGGNTFINTPNLLVFKGEPVFRLYRSDEDGNLGIDFDVYDAQRNRVAIVRNSVVVSGDSNVCEVISGHSEYVVKEKRTGRVIAHVQRRGVAGAELEVAVDMYLPNGALFRASPTATNFGGVTMTGCTIKNCGAGIAIN